jgi:hypothetical protein
VRVTGGNCVADGAAQIDHRLDAVLAEAVINAARTRSFLGERFPDLAGAAGI